jgi:hypothetical protein
MFARRPTGVSFAWLSDDGDVIRLPWTSVVGSASSRTAIWGGSVHGHEIHLAATSAAPRAAREFLRQALGTQDLDGFGDLSELLTTELVANVVDHVGSAITVRVSTRAGLLRVEVDDASSEPPAVQDQDPATPRGNGMLLVDGLATRWGVETGAGGKTVWFELDTATATDEVHGGDRP